VRRDVLHKEATALAQRHQVITVETLNACGMRPRRHPPHGWNGDRYRE